MDIRRKPFRRMHALFGTGYDMNLDFAAQLLESLEKCFRCRAEIGPFQFTIANLVSVVGGEKRDAHGEINLECSIVDFE
jgi:hypothetical protein